MFAHRINGVIAGLFANPQPGHAEELVSEDSPDVVAFLNPPAGVPDRVPMRKAQLLLHSKGYLTAVQSALDGLPGDAGIKARIDWNASSYVLRNNSTTLMMAQLIGLTSQQMDEFFIEADALPDE